MSAEDAFEVATIIAQLRMKLRELSPDCRKLALDATAEGFCLTCGATVPCACPQLTFCERCAIVCYN